MTIRLDYHLHTCHSMDCEQSLDTLCAAAVRTGLTEICITDHTEFGHPYPGSDVPPVVEGLAGGHRSGAGGPGRS